ncbi:MmcQ/YjbR family DNA-binding protein [Agaribacterium sp. ZY112]|uniref:MmcQ/YjbR family DNA-binding protein n=1 Tax=Agaribacterium sp. ZY112 TaxID=3233574 RepID=UPI003525E065
MSVEDYQQQCKAYVAAKQEAKASFPFGPEAEVFKIRGKMFALWMEDYQGCVAVNLKCDPEQAPALRDVFEAVSAGYHMNKKHWNTVRLDGSLPLAEFVRQLDHSFALVAKGLPKKEREALQSLYGPELLRC